MKRLFLLLALGLWLLTRPAAAQAAQVGVTSLADSQLVAAYDSAKATGFPDDFLACVYGSETPDSIVAIDSIAMVPGNCTVTPELIGLFGFVPADQVVGAQQEVWLDRFARMLHDMPGSHIFGVIYGVGYNHEDPPRRVPYALADYR